MDEEDWDGWKRAHRAARRPRAARGRRPVRDQHRAAAARHRAGRGQLDPDQGQPDRHADRDARRDRAWPREAGYTRRHVAPLGRDRGHDDRRPRGGHRLRPDQDGRARRARTAWRSTTSCCASRRSSAPTPPTRPSVLDRVGALAHAAPSPQAARRRRSSAARVPQARRRRRVEPLPCSCTLARAPAADVSPAPALAAAVAHGRAQRQRAERLTSENAHLKQRLHALKAGRRAEARKLGWCAGERAYVIEHLAAAALASYSGCCVALARLAAAKSDRLARRSGAKAASTTAAASVPAAVAAGDLERQSVSPVVQRRPARRRTKLEPSRRAQRLHDHVGGRLEVGAVPGSRRLRQAPLALAPLVEGVLDRVGHRGQLG